MVRGRSTSKRASSPQSKGQQAPKAQQNLSIPDNLNIGSIPDSVLRAAGGTLQLQQLINQVILSNPFIPPTGDRCPINDLPNELLAHIFCLGTSAEEYGCDDDEDDDEYVDTDEEEEGEGGEEDGYMEDDDSDDDMDGKDEMPVLPFQVLVSHVCRHWREVGEFVSVHIILTTQLTASFFFFFPVFRSFSPLPFLSFLSAVKSDRSARPMDRDQILNRRTPIHSLRNLDPAIKVSTHRYHDRLYPHLR